MTVYAYVLGGPTVRAYYAAPELQTWSGTADACEYSHAAAGRVYSFLLGGPRRPRRGRLEAGLALTVFGRPALTYCEGGTRVFVLGLLGAPDPARDFTPREAS